MGPTPRSLAKIPWRGMLTLPVVLAYAFFLAGIFAVWGILTPTLFRKHCDSCFRLWGKGILNILGIRLLLRGEKRLHQGPAVVLFNHVSVLDLPLLAAIWNSTGTIVYKEEFHRIPIIGRVIRQTDFIPINRSDRKSAKQSLDQAADLVLQEKRVLFLAPEGTRSKGQGLLPFKKGPFHLALAVQAPLVPMIMRGFDQVVPGDSWFARPGTIEIDVLAPISTEHWTHRTLEKHLSEVRAVFLRHFPAPPNPAQAAAALGP